ncbi:MAG: response regulator transcription factor [Acidobacteriota bacterium]
MRILLVEDDEEVAEHVRRGLTESGHVVDAVDDGSEALLRGSTDGYDVLVVDRMLPGLDGLSLVRRLREAEVKTPILFLSALGDVDQRVEGLTAGGDDYLPKPFAFSELLARVEALHRRFSQEAPLTRLELADLEMDLLTQEVRRAGQLLTLQPREFRLLEQLLRHAGQVVTRTMLLEKVWDYNFDPQTNVIDVHVSRLRQKIDKDFDPPLIHTVRGSGYVLKVPE